MSQLNDRKYDFGKLVLGYNKTLINEMKSVCFPHPPRGYSRSDLLPAYSIFVCSWKLLWAFEKEKFKKDCYKSSW